MASPSVEVKCLDTFAYYPAFLKDYDNINQVLVGYPNAWKADEWVFLDNVRNAPSSPVDASFRPVAGDVVEAQAKSSDDEPYSWWKATIKTVRGEFYMISYSSWEDEFNEILELDMLRPFNKNPPLRPADIKKVELKLPNDLGRDAGSLDVRALNSVLETSGALSVHVDHKKEMLVILGNAVSVKRAQLLAGMAFKHLVEIQRLKERTSKHQENLATLKQRLNEGHLEVFSIQPQDLIGLVIGVAGKNIKKVEKMSGVLNVRVDSAKSQVSILAKSEEEAKAAREQLEFVSTRFPIARKQAGRVVGKAFSNMDQIQRDSGVVRIRLDDSKKPSSAASGSSGGDDTVDLVIIGTKETVADALLLINHHLEFLNTVSQLTQDEQSLSSELRKMNLDAGIYEAEQRGAGDYRRGGGQQQFGGKGQRGPRSSGLRQYQGDGQQQQPQQQQGGGQQQRGNRQQGQQQQQAAASSSSAPAPAPAADNEERKEQGGNRGRGGKGNKPAAQAGQQQQQPQQQQQQQGGQHRQPKQQQQQSAAAPAADDAAAPADGAQSARKQNNRGQRNQKKDNAAAAGDASPAAPAAAASAAAASSSPASSPAAGGAAAGQPKQPNQPRKQNQNQNQRNKPAGDKPAAAAPDAAASAAAAPASSPVASSPEPSSSPAAGGDKKAQQPKKDNKQGGGRGQRQRHPASELPAAAAAGSPPAAASPPAASPSAQ